MQRLLIQSLILISLLSFSACEKDDTIQLEEIETGSSIDYGLRENVDFVIQIVDEDNIPVESAELILNVSGDSFMSNELGLIQMDGVDIISYGLSARIHKLGYVDQIVILDGISNRKNAVTVTLVKPTKQTITPGERSSITGGGYLTLPQTLELEDGSLYEGDVFVDVYYYDPESPNFLEVSPSELLAFTEEEGLRSLASFGMYSIDLYDYQGHSLAIPEGSLATLEFPIKNEEVHTNGQQIPLWSLDESSGLWVSEGEAHVGEAFFEAKLSHFSFWNIDIKFTPVRAKARLLDSNSTPLAYTNFLVSSVDLQTHYVFGTTDSEGQWIDIFPQSQETVIRVIDHAGNISPPKEISALDSDQDLGTISMDITQRSLSGKAVDCSDIPLANAIVRYSTSTTVKFLQTQENGDFRVSLFSESDIEITLFDFENGEVGEVLTIEDMSTFISLGEIRLCEADAVIIIDSDIEEDMVWEYGKTYILDGVIYVKDNATLTIEPGVIIKGTDRVNEGDLVSSLIIRRGSKIIANGTQDRPIIFTSFYDNIRTGSVESIGLDSDASGLWGGIFIFGEGVVNGNPGTLLAADLLDFSITSHYYGGDNPDDNSGILNYVSIRYSGGATNFACSSSRTHPLYLGGVGSATQISNVEITNTRCNGIKLHGGSVDLENILIWGAENQGLEIGHTWTGTLNNNIYSGLENNDGRWIWFKNNDENDPKFQLLNCSVKGTQYEDYFTLSRSNLTIQNCYFFDFGEQARVYFSAHAERKWMDYDDDVIVDNLQFNTSHLTSGNRTIEEIFSESDVFIDRPPNAQVVTVPTVGADKSVFDNWTWAYSKGVLDIF